MALSRPTSKAMEKRSGDEVARRRRCINYDGLDIPVLRKHISFLSLSYFIYLKINKRPGRLLDPLRYSSIFWSVLYRFVVSVV